MENLATGAQLDKKTFQFLLNMMLISKSAYAEFRKGRYEQKSVQLFRSIAKTIIYHQSYRSKGNKDILILIMQDFVTIALQTFSNME